MSNHHSPSSGRMRSRSSTLRPIPLAGTGVVGGAVGALLGGGTGVVTVPLLDRFTDLRRAVVHGTANIPNAAVAVVGSALLFVRGGHVELRVGVGMMIGGVVGAIIGARLAARVSEFVLRSAFAIVLGLAGVELCFNAAGYSASGSPTGFTAVLGGVWVFVGSGVVLGVIVGAWSAAMGLGGGSLTVPILVLLYGMNPHTAEGTSLLVMLPNSIAASAQHLRQRTALPRLGSKLAVGAAIGAVLGVLVSLVLPARVLSAVFGLFALLIAGREAKRLWRQHAAE